MFIKIKRVHIYHLPWAVPHLVKEPAKMLLAIFDLFSTKKLHSKVMPRGYKYPE